MRIAIATGAALVFLTALTVTGEERKTRREATMERAPATTTASPSPRRVSDLFGASVLLRGRELGKISDVTYTERGMIDYVMVRTTEDLVAVPWHALRYDARERAHVITANVTEERLKDVRFPSGRWPDLASDRWAKAARLVWGDRHPREDNLSHDERDRRDARIQRDEKVAVPAVAAFGTPRPSFLPAPRPRTDPFPYRYGEDRTTFSERRRQTFQRPPPPPPVDTQGTSGGY